MPVAGSAMKQRGQRLTGLSLAATRVGRGVPVLRDDVERDDVERVRGVLARVPGTRVVDGETSRMSKPRRTR